MKSRSEEDFGRKEALGKRFVQPAEGAASMTEKSFFF